MGIFRQFPYSNFHEMNMDEILKIVKTMNEEWNETKTEWNSYKEFIDNYFENLDVSAEVLSAIHLLASTGELNNIIDPVIASETAEWLQENITPTTPVIDASLTIEGAGADAKATGEAINANKNALVNYQNGILFLNVIDGGYISNVDGSLVNYSNWSYTDFISLDDIGSLIAYIVKPGQTTANYNAFYDSNHNFISAIPIPYNKNYKIEIPENAKYVRFSDQTATMHSNYTVHYRTRAYSDLLDYQNAELILDIFDGGYISNTDGTYVPYNNWSCTDYIALDNINTLSAFIDTGGQSPYYSPYNAFYDANKVFISGFSFTNNVESEVSVPTGAKFARFSGQTATLKNKTRIKYLINGDTDTNSRPYKIRVMQNNIGHFRWGYDNLNDWGLTAAQYTDKRNNYIKLFEDYQPDIVLLSEYEKFMDKAQTHNTKQALFNHIFAYASINDADSASEVVYANCRTMGNFEIKSFTGSGGGATESCRFANGMVTIKDSVVKVMSGYLHPGSLANVANDTLIRAEQFENLLSYADNFDNVIIGIDTNVYSDAELTSILNIAGSHNFKSCNNSFHERKTTYVSHTTTPLETAEQYYKKIDNIFVKGHIMVESNIVPYEYVTPNESGSYTNEPIRASVDKLASDHIPVITDLVFY